MTRLKAVPWVLGVCVVAASLVGANRLLHPEGQSPGGGAAPRPGDGAPVLNGGTIALGTVDSDPSPVRVGPPGIGMQLTVREVFVKDLDTVPEGAKLVQFDDGMFQPKLGQAKAELTAAVEAKKQAVEAKKVHEVNVVRQQEAIRQAEDDHKTAQTVYAIENDKFEKFLKIDRDGKTDQLLTEEQRQDRRNKNVELIQARALISKLKAKHEDEKRKLEALQLDPVDATIARAEAQIKGCEAKVEEAKSYIDACVVKARRAGVVEQVFAAPGMTYGPSTREPLMRLIPAGKRVVRAEVEAEFAFKVADKIGTKVTVYDANNFALTYAGTVTGVSTAFLPKRTAAEVLTVGPSLVLECLIEVTDPSPPGRPPLRVGQPVRVSIP